MKPAEKQLNRLIGAYGCSEEVFFSSQIEQLRANKVAINALKRCGHLLSDEEVQVLYRFVKEMRSKNTRQKITKQKCYQVLNIGKAVNRQLFKRKRIINQSFK